MHVTQQCRTGHGRRRMAGSHVVTRLPGGLVIRLPRHRQCRTGAQEAVAQRPARPTVSRESAGSSPVGFVQGSCSSPVERLGEIQRVAGSIPAGAIMPPWRNAYARRSERRGPLCPWGFDSLRRYSSTQVRSSPGRARGCGPRGGGSSPPHLIFPPVAETWYKHPPDTRGHGGSTPPGRTCYSPLASIGA